MEALVLVDYGIVPKGLHAGRYFEALTDAEIMTYVPSLPNDSIGRAIHSKLHPLYEKIRLAEIASRVEVSEYYGNIGDTVEIEVTIKSSFWIKQTGVFVISMEDDEGHSFSAFHSPTMKFKKGEICKITGLISGHKEYRGQQQTCLRHIKKVI